MRVVAHWCSTPTGIKVIFSLVRDQFSTNISPCSTPTGIKVIFRKQKSEIVTKSSGAQRLPASKLYSVTFIFSIISIYMCSTPTGIKVIFRKTISIRISIIFVCSTPTGIKVIFRAFYLNGFYKHKLWI